MTFFRLIIKWGFRLCLLAAIGFGGVLTASYLLGPPNIDIDSVTVFFDRDEVPIGDAAAVMEQKTSLSDMSTYVVDATVAVEDRYFYSHHGFDFRGIIRAIIKNIKSMHLKEGASTITQQYARNLYLSHEKTWLRKLKEAFYTIRLEMFYSKDDILNGYLNTIYYGHGAYGIAAASYFYFDKPVGKLSLAESAMLAGIPKGPTYYSPFNDMEKAYSRQQLILQKMLEFGLISQADYFLAKAEELPFSDNRVQTDHFAAYFKDTAVREAAKILQEDQADVLASGYTIYTSLDQDLQKKTEDFISEQIEEDSDIQIGVLTIRPEDGAVLSLIGGRDYGNSPFNRAIDAKRMVGSAFKPILYYAALEHGYTPTTMLLSEPTSFVMADGDVYKPSNFNNYYAYKPITLAQAIALSDNIYAVKTNLFLEPKKVVEVARKFGIKGELPDVPSLALGSASISVLEMTEAYGVIANGGRGVRAYTIERIENRHGKTIYQRDISPGKRVLDERKAFILTHLMTGMFDRRLNGYMEVTGSSIIDKLTHLYAGKSGTTDTDNWMIGFSPSAVTGVWTGYDHNKPIQKTSDKIIAKNVWAMIMEETNAGKEISEFVVPKGIVKKIVDPEKGLLATEECPVARVTYFEKGTEPTRYCKTHRKGDRQDKSPEKGKRPGRLWERLFKLFD